MKVAMVSASLSRQAGGIFEIELALARQLQLLGTQCEAFGLKDSQWVVDSKHWEPVSATAFTHQGPAAFGYAPTLLQALLASESDIAHLQTLWMYPSVAIHNWSKITKRPYLVTPNGMLEPWALQNSGWKKKLAGLLYENRMLQGADCLQANTEKEVEDIRAYGLRNPVAIIPNGVTLPQTNVEASAPWRGKLRPGSKLLLYLGRLHAKKNLLNLIRAWAANCDGSSGSWVLAIAGWDQGGHEAELKKLATDLKLPWSDLRETSIEPTMHFPLLFTGPAFGELKSAFYREADGFILPSLSEGLPMVVLEAWAHSKPVLMTPACNLPDGFNENAAFKMNPDLKSIGEGLQAMFDASDSTLNKMGENGRRLVEARFTWEQVAWQMKTVYEWVLGQESKPVWVRDV